MPLRTGLDDLHRIESQVRSNSAKEVAGDCKITASLLRYCFAGKTDPVSGHDRLYCFAIAKHFLYNIQRR